MTLVGNSCHIIFEDDGLLVLNKPSGVPSAPRSPGNDQELGTAVHWVASRFPSLIGVGLNPNEFGLIHRLDTGTSGLLVFAKNQEFFFTLRSIWKSPSVQKIYRARVAANNAEVFSTLPVLLTLKLAHSKKSKRKMMVLNGQRDQKRRSLYRGKVLESWTEILGIKDQLFAKWIELEVRIRTGIMHQIRCTFAYLKCPILGDKLYGGAPASRLFLHSEKIVLPNLTAGKAGETIQLCAPLPEDWVAHDGFN